MQQGSFAVVTGASQGLGRCFALELAKRSWGIILVSLPGENIDQVAAEVRALGVVAETYETDLTDKGNILSLCQWINSRFAVSVLVNNAGMGGSRSFLEASPEYLETMLKLNIGAPVLLSRLLLPNLCQQERSYILNVASVASFSPIGYKTVYPASKRFLQHFSLGLGQEFKEQGVRVSVTLPGPMKTNVEVTRRIQSQGFLASIYAIEPEKVAKKSIRQMLAGRKVIMPGWESRLTWLFASLFPRWVCLPWLSKVARREIHIA